MKDKKVNTIIIEEKKEKQQKADSWSEKAAQMDCSPVLKDWSNCNKFNKHVWRKIGIGLKVNLVKQYLLLSDDWIHLIFLSRLVCVPK